MSFNIYYLLINFRLNCLIIHPLIIRQSMVHGSCLMAKRGPGFGRALSLAMSQEPWNDLTNRLLIITSSNIFLEKTSVRFGRLPRAMVPRKVACFLKSRNLRNRQIVKHKKHAHRTTIDICSDEYLAKTVIWKSWCCPTILFVKNWISCGKACPNMHSETEVFFVFPK